MGDDAPAGVDDSWPDWACWPPPWDGVSAKLRHAWRHFTLLTTLTRDFIASGPLRTECRADPDRGPNWLKFDLHVTHPDTDITLTLGDFLHNLRCALDHSLTAIDPQGGRRMNFPAALTEAEFEEWSKRWAAAGGSAAAAGAIRTRQPFHATDGLDPEDYVLRIVARLNNKDKHRLLNVTPIGLSDEKPPSLEIESNAAVVEHYYLLAGGWPLEDCQTALLVKLDRPVGQVAVNLKGHIPIGVSVDDRYGDAVALGADLHQGVRNTCIRLREDSLAGWPGYTRGA